MPYIKLSDLINKQFRIKKVLGYHYQMWSDAQNKFLKSDTPQKGFSRKWQVEVNTREGNNVIDVSDDFLSRVLLDAFAKGCSIDNQIVYLKTNGKTGKDIRYYPDILLVKQQVEPVAEQPIGAFNTDLNINTDDIPW